jgi:hypothetical protein
MSDSPDGASDGSTSPTCSAARRAAHTQRDTKKSARSDSTSLISIAATGTVRGAGMRDVLRVAGSKAPCT